MMVHHDNNHHRPFRSPSSKFDGDGDVTAGTNARFYSSGGAVNGGLGVVGGATHGSRPLNHPPFESVIPTSSSSFSGMGYPFTQAQWRELERQAMIYKHMVASVPVPPDLLFPLPSVPDSHYSLGAGSCSLRFGKDPEPGRCRRTDGKKWRCSRDAALDQKYCERHLNRGRPRSRKHVEVSASITSSKKNRHCHGSNAPLPSTSAALTSATESHHNHQAPPMFVQGAGGFEPATVAHNKEARGLDWLMMGDHRIEEDALGHNSNYSTTEANQLNEYLFPLSNSDVFHLAEQQRSTTRGFIDAWSDSNSKQSCPASQHDQKLSLYEEMGPINMCLGVTTNWSQSSDAGLGSWISPAPGGPLGEVFRAAANTVSSPSSLNSGSPQISSPSGVLQRKMASVSDSSGGSSPILGSSMGRSEITVQWFNPN